MPIKIEFIGDTYEEVLEDAARLFAGMEHYPDSKPEPEPFWNEPEENIKEAEALEPPKKEKPKPQPKAEEPKAEEPKAEAAPDVTQDEVKKAMAAAVKQGKRNEVKQILKDNNVARLTEASDDQLGPIYVALKELM